MEQEQVSAMMNNSTAEEFEAPCFRGINVLGRKSELEKVLAKQRKASEEVSDEHKNDVEHEFKKVLSERARRLEKVKVFSFEKVIQASFLSVIILTTRGIPD